MGKRLVLLFGMLYLLAAFSTTTFAATLRVGANEQFQTVQEALMAAKDFDTIRIEPGVYRSDKNILIKSRQGLNIEGAGPGKVQLIVTNLRENVISIRDSRGIRIANLTAYHDPQVSPGGVCTGSVISVSYSDNTTIIDCELNGCGRVGVGTYEARGINVIHNNIHHNSEAGLSLYRSTGLVENNIIIDNKEVVTGKPDGVVFRNNSLAGNATTYTASGPLNINDFAIMGIMLGDPAVSVMQRLGDSAKKTQVQEGMSYDYGNIEIVVNNMMVVNILTDDKSVATRRGIRTGSPIGDIVAAYGENYTKTPLGNLDLYEYTYGSNDYGKYVLRFAVNRASGAVQYIGCRAASVIESAG